MDALTRLQARIVSERGVSQHAANELESAPFEWVSVKFLGMSKLTGYPDLSAAAYGEKMLAAQLQTYPKHRS